MRFLTSSTPLKAIQPFKHMAWRALPSLGFSTSSQCRAEPPQTQRPMIGASSLFDSLTVEEQTTDVKDAKNKEFHWSSANFRTSPRKLNMLARQLRQLTVGEAIKQMEFSPKRSAKKILHNLAFAQKNATDQKGMKNMIIDQAWVGKGRYEKRFRTHARGRFGVMHIKQAHIKFILKEAPSVEESQQSDRRNIRGWKEAKKVFQPLIENKPIYNPKPFYNW